MEWNVHRIYGRCSDTSHIDVWLALPADTIKLRESLL